MSDDIAIRVEHVSKEYRLGMIGGTTLREELQSLWAKMRGKEDPNCRIGTDHSQIGKKFLALNDVSFEVKKGEALGIIGHNGAGKSTLLKLLSRVTAPTKGEISYNGRIASMLEVGTGFHPELTGRENVYMNGAILGMRKREIDKKFDEIVAFAEMEKFIDTPVKRYSSGMYVKLAFAVAAHLDAENMIMDEVLAVGDMKFQQKCLERMSHAAHQEGRTVFYVSHNMNTIRKLCGRCIVLDHGEICFNGEPELAIQLYMGDHFEKKIFNDFSVRTEDPWITSDIKILSLEVLGNGNIIQFGNKFSFCLRYYCNKNIKNLSFRFTILQLDRIAVATTTSNAEHSIVATEYKKNFTLDVSHIAPGEYQLQIVAFEPDGAGNQIRHDYLPTAVFFSIYIANQLHNFEWSRQAWGSIVLPPPTETFIL